MDSNMNSLKEAIKKLVDGEDLSEKESFRCMDEIMSGKASPAQIAAFLVALRLKGETVDEIAGFARVMKEKALPVKTSHRVLVDTCGTGGDGSNTFNISTASALVVAGAGTAVAKHGNRSASGRCGSADVLEALDINIYLSPEMVGRCLDKVGIAFLFAPALHGSMKHAAGPRRDIGVRTVFNLLGPLTNPAKITAQVLGVYSKENCRKLARVIARMGGRKAFVVHGENGADELTPCGPALVCRVDSGQVVEYRIDPLEYGIPRADLAEIEGGCPEENAIIIKRVLGGERGPRRNAVLLNAAMALMCAGAANDIEEGLNKAGESIDRGSAMKKMHELGEFCSAVQGGA